MCAVAFNENKKEGETKERKSVRERKEENYADLDLFNFSFYSQCVQFIRNDPKISILGCILEHD